MEKRLRKCPEPPRALQILHLSVMYQLLTRRQFSIIGGRQLSLPPPPLPLQLTADMGLRMAQRCVLEKSCSVGKGLFGLASAAPTWLLWPT